MSDPLSITAGIVGIVAVALQGTRLLLNELEQFKDTPKIIRRLAEDVQSVNNTLYLLENVDESDWESLGTTIAEHSKATIISCTNACNIFRADLDRWTKHSNDGKYAWQDRTKLAIFRQSQVKAMSEQLQSCRLSINSVVSIATLYSSVRHTHITDEIKEIISTKHTEVEGAITSTDNQLAVLDYKLKELDLSSDEEVTELDEGKTKVLQQLEEERKALGASHTLLKELLVKSQEDCVARAALGHKTSSNTMTNGNVYSSIVAWTINGSVTVCGSK
ncbi:hypothetical protein N0V90_011877 [Kalmusia sp. IMI 367209]|nr:hypothetical protein N0V90_011877 [Kalmusia sp. IMI 367209]